MSLHDLLAAERALGRLIEALSGDGARALWQADALRRDAIASEDLDGHKVAWDDLVVAQIDATLLPHGLRPAMTGPLRLIAAGHRLIQDGDRPVARPAPAPDETDEALEDVGFEVRNHPGPDRRPERPTTGTEIDAVLAAVHRSKAEIAAFIRQPDQPPPAAGDPGRPGSPRAAPLTAGWLAAAWRQLAPDAEPLASGEALAAMIEEKLQKPGLTGVAAALHGLHQDGLFPEPAAPDYSLAALPPELGRSLTLAAAQNRAMGPGWRFARMLAPWLIMRACGLQMPGPWISPALQAGARSYGRAAVDGEGPWSAGLFRLLADGFGGERARLAELAALVARWEKALTAKRRWASSRRALLLLVDRPAVTSRLVQRQRGISRRAAQMLTREWEQLGILRRIHHAKGQEWWLADQVRGRQ